MSGCYWWLGNIRKYRRYMKYSTFLISLFFLTKRTSKWDFRTVKISRKGKCLENFLDILVEACQLCHIGQPHSGSSLWFWLSLFVCSAICSSVHNTRSQNWLISFFWFFAWSHKVRKVRKLNFFKKNHCRVRRAQK